MAGSYETGVKAAETMKAKYGKDYYRELGKKGRGVPRPGAGFAADRERASRAGKIGGAKSRRLNIPHDGIKALVEAISWPAQ